jgi:Xaa-Pro aminopeptidase
VCRLLGNLDRSNVMRRGSARVTNVVGSLRVRLLKRAVLVALFVGCCGVRDAARAVAEQELPPEEFRQRLSRFVNELGGAVAVLKDAGEPEAYRPFRQYNTFFYLTGVEIPDAVLLASGKQKQLTLFLPHVGELRDLFEVWHRRGIHRVCPLGELARHLQEALRDAEAVYLERWPGEGPTQSRDSFRPPWKLLPGYEPRDEQTAFREAVLRMVPEGLTVRDVESITDAMRRVKSPAEVQLMRRAAEIAATAIAEAIRSARPGMREAELAGLCLWVFAREGAHGAAWHPIVASGPNVLNLHHMRQTRRLQPGDVVLMDVGPDYAYYCSDIARCWPVTGNLPARHQELYDKLVEVHRVGIEAVRPGARPRDVALAMRRKAEALGMGRYLLPIPGHYTGMAAHDVGSWEAPFEPGAVFNVEPLLLIPDEAIHLRLEDPVLCTEDGPEVLTPLEKLPWEMKQLLEIRDARP